MNTRYRLRTWHLALMFVVAIVLSACQSVENRSQSVFLLLDTSGTYTEELNKAQTVINYLLASLDSGDSFAIARIDSGSFSEKDIIAKQSFSDRPSLANEQKRLFKQQVDQFVEQLIAGSAHTDITGGLIQAVDYLNETGAGKRTVLIFSDLEEDLERGQIRDFDIHVEGIHVVALNVTKLNSDNIDPRDYQQRLAHWQQRVEQGGGSWQVLNDLQRLDTLVIAP